MPAKKILVRQRNALWINYEIRALIEKRKMYYFFLITTTKKQNKVIEKPTGENSSNSELRDIKNQT